MQPWCAGRSMFSRSIHNTCQHIMLNLMMNKHTICRRNKMSTKGTREKWDKDDWPSRQQKFWQWQPRKLTSCEDWYEPWRAHHMLGQHTRHASIAQQLRHIFLHILPRCHLTNFLKKNQQQTPSSFCCNQRGLLSSPTSLLMVAGAISCTIFLFCLIFAFFHKSWWRWKIEIFCWLFYTLSGRTT